MFKIYISGKITGLEEEEYTKNFMEAEKQLKKVVSKNIMIINPIRLGFELRKINPYPTYDDYMKVCLDEIDKMRVGDIIFMLHNWKDSSGAIEEHAAAIKKGIIVIKQGKG